MEKNEFMTIPQLAKILGISRIAVYNKVKTGEIKAIRIGRNYAIIVKDIVDIIGQELLKKDKKEIDKGVTKVVAEYGEVLKLLGRE
jgi:excisionase family DNA binding protein